MAKTLQTIDWSNIDTVLLDMDGTLLDLHYDNYFWSEYLPLQISQRDGISLQAAKDAVIPVLRSTTGTLPFYCIDHWSKVFELDILTLKKQVAHKIALRDGARGFLQNLRQKNKHIVLATNAHRATIDLKIAQTKLHGSFNEISSSHDYGFAKEHREYWSHLSRDKAINLQRCLFIDDNHNVLAAAQKSGVHYVIGIRKPDSQRAEITSTDFLMTNDFRELMH